jgi:hypothetical protein
LLDARARKDFDAVALIRRSLLNLDSSESWKGAAMGSGLNNGGAPMPRGDSQELSALQRIEERISLGEFLISRQEAMVARLQLSGKDAVSASQLLETLRAVVENYKRIMARVIGAEARQRH